MKADKSITFSLTNKSFRNILLSVTLVIGIALSILVSVLTYNAEVKLMWHEFSADVENRQSALKREIDLNLQLIKSLQALYYHSIKEKDKDVKRDEFRNFTSHILKQYEDIQALEWIPRVQDSRRKEYESSAKREGLSDFRFFERTAQGKTKKAEKRKEYFPVYFAEPYKGNEIALGFDLASDPTIRESMEVARKSGEIIATWIINLSEEATSQVDIAIFAPVYRRGVLLNSDQTRWDNLEGFTAVIIRIGSSIEEAMGYLAPAGIDFIIYATSATEKEQPLYTHSSRIRKTSLLNKEPETRLRLTKTLDVAGRKWKIIYSATPERMAASGNRSHWGFLLLGLLVTGLVMGVLSISARRTAQAEKSARALSEANTNLEAEIAERSRAAEELRESEARYRHLFDNMLEGFAYCRMLYRDDTPQDFVYIHVNAAFESLTGLQKVEGRKVSEVIPGIHESNPELLRIYGRVALTGHPERFETFSESFGGWLYVSAYSTERDHFIAVFDNITERKKLEEQLRHAQKMEAIGTLAGGVAHDFNNLLNIILGYGVMVQDCLEAGSPAKEQMKEVIEAADRAASLTKRLLLFSRKEAAEVKPVVVNDLVINMEKMLSRIIGEDIKLVADLMGKKALVMADAGQMEQVLLNLASNARDAMPEGGSLTISTDLREIDAGFVSAYEYGAPGTYAVISVTDTGSGIDKEQQDKIFDPYFTTKEVGKGTGLGLSIVYGIIKHHNGLIKVYSETGKGTTFKIWLPVIENTAKKQMETEALSSPKGGAETILVAEDDASLRKLTRVILESAGYTVITAEDGEEAITQFMENKDRIALAVLDMIMPNKNGKEVAEEIRKVSPGTKILFASGYTMDIIKTRELTEAGLDIILKPVLPRDLLRKVREILDRKSKNDDMP